MRPNKGFKGVNVYSSSDRIFILFKVTQETIQFYIVCQYINDILYIVLHI